MARPHPWTKASLAVITEAVGYQTEAAAPITDDSGLLPERTIRDGSALAAKEPGDYSSRHSVPARQSRRARYRRETHILNVHCRDLQ
jgi:hypothetical protein